MLDIPRFKSHVNVKRFLFEKAALLLILGILLYLGIYVNYWLSEKSVPDIWNWIIIVGVVVLLFMEMLLTHIKYSGYEYVFYDTKMKIHASKDFDVEYMSIRKILFKHDFLDKMFATSTILLEVDNDGSTKKIKLRDIDNGNQVYFFLQKSIK